MKGQSAMEYLMTYGWAILIIAIVLVAFFALGLFKSPTGTTCRSPSGYVCSNPIFNSGTNKLSVTVGQGTGSDWTVVTFTMNGTGIPSALTANMGSANSISLAGGALVTINFTIPTADTSPGSIYAHYTVSSTNQITQVATASWS